MKLPRAIVRVERLFERPLDIDYARTVACVNRHEVAHIAVLVESVERRLVSLRTRL